ncbi:hypothetical protein K437DRAFT_35087 [Tilletiaria anomala UBC 951]|uniref:Dystroglycan-type cadherin-like domain-containing protein n=1 Tax=Tilletiaria anomala (strain ATCC 24038 / CBS 436.72 / UBC 951) TaxID=1037660 RepID=A0A066V7V3_TILAU|nr:uncharacterized protein K437DRAFT_35087 [Tilletiaria anomala UBC 951]KDN37807.1 hypothetical protein K437DRAFT_35087 [Tilletiaria anomala UBC 951]
MSGSSAMSSPMGRWAMAALLTMSLSSVQAALTVNNSLASQLPELGHAGQPFQWTFSDNTFTDDSKPNGPPAGLTYEVDGLPPWCKFDPAQRSFSGTPQNTDLGKSWITLTANDAAAQSDSDGFMLSVIRAPAPTLAMPLPQQLPVASSLGPANILADGAQHIPLGWSFSIGFNGDTFTLPDGSDVYLSAKLATGAPLPGWLHFSADTNTFFGVAPTQPGPEGASFDVVMTGSNLPGYGGPTTSFTIVVSQHALTLGGPLRSVNATVGDSFRYSIPTSGLKLDGRQSPPSNHITMKVDTSHVPWLTFDATNSSIAGTPPDNLIPANSTNIVTVQVPVTFADTFNNSLPANLSLNIYPSIFTGSMLPNIIVDPGTPFNRSLSSLIRTPVNSSKPLLSVQYDPATAARWLTFDNSTYLLSGRPPMNPSEDRVKVFLHASSNSTDDIVHTGQASFSIAVTGDSDTGLGGSGAGASPSGGLSPQGRVALGASLGTAGGLIMLVALMICCRRWMAVEDHDANGRVKHYGSGSDDDVTLAGSIGSKSPKMGIIAYKPSWQHNEKQLGTPSTLVPSPSPDHTAIKLGNNGNIYEDAVRHYHDAEALQRAAAADARPQKHVFFKSILKQPRKPPISISISRPQMQEDEHSGSSTGLGLSLDGQTSDQPYRTSPTRSQRSLGSRKASWETDIFHENITPASPAGSTTPRSTASRGEDMPVRRSGPARRLLESAIRQRGGHAKESPAFTTTQRFEKQPMAEEEATEEGDLANAEVKYVSQVSLRSVQRHQPALMTIARNVSSKVQVDDSDGVFDDAEDEIRDLKSVGDKQTGSSKRLSALSYTTDHNGPGAVEGGVIYDQRVPPSPAPGSIFGAASISSQTRPEETMRTVGAPAPVPQVAQQASSVRSSSRPSSRTSWTEDMVQVVVADFGEMLRTKIKLRQPPPLQGGAPGSPGKRSARKTVYLPVLDDDQSSDHLQLPLWLSWLSWDPRLCELSGMVPADLGPHAVQIPLALVARTTPDASASTHSRQNSSGSNKTTTGTEDEIVARMVLELKPPGYAPPVGGAPMELFKY